RRRGDALRPETAVDPTSNLHARRRHLHAGRYFRAQAHLPLTAAPGCSLGPGFLTRQKEENMKTFRAIAVAAVLSATILGSSAANARSPIGDLFCWLFPEICEPLDL